MSLCPPCGASDGNSCQACLSGNPPPERLEWEAKQREERLRAAQRKIEAELTEALQALPEAYSLLGEFILPGSRPPDPDRVRVTSSPARPPLVLDVVDLTDIREKPDASPVRDDFESDRQAGARRQGILPTLASWVRLVDGELWDADRLHPEPSEAPTVDTECRWLLGHVRWISQQQWGEEIRADVEWMLADVRRVTGWKPEPQDVCTSCGWAVEERDGGTWYACTGCNKTWARNQITRLFEDQSWSMTLRACAEEVERPVSTLKEWCQRGWLLAVGKNQAGQFLFDVRKAEQLAKDQPRHREKQSA